MPPRSKIATLPEDVRRELDRRLIERGFGSHAELADWLQAKGYEIARPSVQRHSQNLQSRIEKIQLATQGAEALVDAAGDTGALADASMRLIQERMWDVLIASEDKDIKKLSSAARALADTARASVMVQQERRKVLQEASDAVGAAARSQGISPALEKMLRDAIEGRA